VKPQTGAFLDKSRELVANAEKMLAVGLNEDAGRTAYLAALHAAQAFIFETTGKKPSKRHSTVQGQFSQLVKDDPRVDDNLRAFLGRAYNLKAIADYETGPGSHLSPATAREATATARRFVQCVASLIPPNGPGPERTPETPSL
jgi:uncharacterized protein (UPF0332 family)